MKLKIAQGILLTKEQLEEVANTIMTKPDMGWNYDDEKKETVFVQDYELTGEFGTYIYRVNLSWEMITLLNVK